MPRSIILIKTLSFIVGNFLLVMPCHTQFNQFYAYYTNVTSFADNNSNPYSDIVVKVSNRGELVFDHKKGHLPYWKVGYMVWEFKQAILNNSTNCLQDINNENVTSSVRILKESCDEIIVHHRFIYNVTSPHLTQFKATYTGDLADYMADFADEYFSIKPNGTVIRTLKIGCYLLSDWENEQNESIQELTLNEKGIVEKIFKTANINVKQINFLKGSKLKSSILKGSLISFSFDDALQNAGFSAIETISGKRAQIGGVDHYWQSGVSGTALMFDGYTSNVSWPANNVPVISKELSISVWIAPQEYSVAQSAIVDHSSTDEKSGYFLGINQFGQIAFNAFVKGKWQGVTSSVPAPLLKWTYLTAVYDTKTGFYLYFNGEQVAHLEATGSISDARGLDLLIGMSHKNLGPICAEREITKEFRSKMVFSGLIDEVRILDKVLNINEIKNEFNAYSPEIVQPLLYSTFPVVSAKSNTFEAFYTTLKYSKTWDGLWRVGNHADIAVTFEDLPGRFMFWRGTGYLPSLVSDSSSKAIWVNDQGPEIYNGQCFEHMSDKICRFAYVQLIENSPARGVVHWHNASVNVAYEWNEVDSLGHGLVTDEYWYIYPDGISVRNQVSQGVGCDRIIEMQQSELLNQPGTKPQDNIEMNTTILSNINGDVETWNSESGKSFIIDDSISGNKNLVYQNLKSEYKFFNIGEVGARWEPFDRWKNMDMAPGFSMFNAWNHWPVGLFPSDGTVATAVDRPSSTCMGTFREIRHKSGKNRIEAMNIYGLTNQPASALKNLNRSWNSAPKAINISGCILVEYKKEQRAYVLNYQGNKIIFTIDASVENPLENVCLVVENWNSEKLANVKLNSIEQNLKSITKQGIVRNTSGNQNLVIWIKYSATDKTVVEIN